MGFWSVLLGFCSVLLGSIEKTMCFIGCLSCFIGFYRDFWCLERLKTLETKEPCKMVVKTLPPPDPPVGVLLKAFQILNHQ